MLALFENLKPRHKKALSRAVSMMLVLVTLLGMMVIPAGAASTNTAWPEVNAGQYIEMVVLQDKIPCFQDVQLTRRGNLSTSRVYDSYAACGDLLFVKDVIDLGNGKVSCLASIPTAAGRIEGYLSAKDVFGTYYPLGELVATERVVTYVNAELSTRSGSVFAQDVCWELGRTASQKRLMLYPAPQNSRGYKAAWVSAADYEQHFTKKTNDNKVIPVTGITMSAVNAACLEVGQTTQAQVVVSPKNATYNLTFSSSDVNVVTVDGSGNIKAVGAGDAKVYAHTGNTKGILKVHVEAPPAPKPDNKTSAWPTLSASCYLEMVLPCEVPAYRDSQLSARGTASPYKTYGTARGFKGDLVRIEYIDEQVTYFRYPIGSSYAYAYAPTESIFGVTSPAYAKAQVKETSYVYPDFSQRSGSTAVGDDQYWCGRKGDFQLCIYTAVSGQRSYKAAFIHRPEQESLPDDKVDPVPPQPEPTYFYLADGYYRFASVIDPACYLSIGGEDRSKDGATTVLTEEESSLGSPYCRFYVERQLDGTYTIQVGSPNGKYLEIKNALTTNGAALGQLTKDKGNHAHWRFIAAKDGSVLIESVWAPGMLINICGGEAKHNNTVWLWQRDDAYLSHASFVPIRLKEQDVYEATFTRKVRDEEIKWTSLEPSAARSATSIAPAVTGDTASRLTPVRRVVMTGSSSSPTSMPLLSAANSVASMSGIYTAAPQSKIINHTDWQKTDANGTVLYPSHGQTFLTEVHYLNSAAAAVLLKASARKDTIQRLAKAPTEEDVTNLMIDLGLEFLDYGFMLGVLKDLAELLRNEQFNEMIDHIKINKGGTASGLIIYTYEKVVHATDNRLYPGETHIMTQTITEYETWDGTGLKAKANADTKNMTGKWTWSFT